MNADNGCRMRLQVGGMDCGSCAAKIETALRRLPGVGGVSVSLSTGNVVVDHDGSVRQDDVTGRITALGFTTRSNEGQGDDRGGHGRLDHDGHSDDGHDHDHDHDHGHSHGHPEGARPWWRGRQGMLTLGCGVALAAAYGIGHVFPAVQTWVFLAALSVGLVPVAWKAFNAARLGSPFSIEMLMSVAAIGAVVIGAQEEAAAVVFLFLVGEALEGLAAARARSGIRDLAQLMPKTARREGPDGSVEEIAADDLRAGEVIQVRPGDRIAADGTVLAGQSSVDEAPVTGESVPRAKAPGDAVFAGTINGEGLLRVTVTATAADNTIARIVRLVEEAQDSKAPTARFIDRFARRYTPAVVALAILVAVVPPLLAGADWNTWIYRGLAVLLIGCPCALVISTPAAIASGLSAGARRGLLLKGGAVLEELGRIDAVAFDKTGTLTEGRPRVTHVQGFGLSDDRVLALAAALSTGSSHPLSRAILDRAAADGAAPLIAADVAAVPGQGVTGTADGVSLFLGSPQAVAGRALLPGALSKAVAALAEDGNTVSVLMADGKAVGVLALKDSLRPDAIEGVAALRRLGVSSFMVTGDQERAAQAVGRQLGMDVHAQLLPQDKLDLVRARQAKGERVAKVGDGINDAPALAAADVGISMGSGTDVALETADAAILHGRVGDVAAMIALSRRTLSNIRQNVAIALGLKAVFLVTTVLGITGLWPAVLADTGATVLVTANALRLLKGRV